jgi:SPP1 family phage portal protein
MDILFDPNINRLSNMELCRLYMDEFIKSKERAMMLAGEAYYRVDNPEIMSRKMYRYQENKGTGAIEKIEDKAKPNNKRAHGFMHVLIEDKVNYLLSKQYTLACKGADDYLKLVQDTIGKMFQEKRLMKLGVKSSNGGISWLHPYINEDGAFKTMIIPPEQGIPLWHDNDHEELDGFIYFYDLEMIEGKEQKTITRVELWLPDGVAYYISDSEGEGWDLKLDSERYLNAVSEDGEIIEHFVAGGTPDVWEKVPFIPFKNNDYELSDLKFIKSLIDAYDKSRSNVANIFDEVSSTIFALKGYGGEDLGQFMRDLNYFRAISIDADESAGVEAINSSLDITALKEDFEALKKDIYDFGQGVDKNSDKLGNSPSGIALKFIYSGLDLKCNRMENAFKEGLEQLFWFVNRYLELTGKGSYFEKEIDITFNRDIAINESQAITDCQNSVGIISDETIMENHPWTKSVEEEKKRMEKQEEEREEREKTVTDMLTENGAPGLEGDDT